MSFDLSRALPYLSPIYSAEDTAPIRAHGSRDAPIARAFSTTLNVHYMLDEPGAVVFVRERDVAAERREALHERAIENLRSYVKGRRLRFEAKGSLTVAKLDGNHDASLLLLDELWDPPTRIADFPGDLVAAVPARGLFLVTGTGTPGAVAELRASVARTSDRALSPELFRRQGGNWESLDG